MFVSVGYFTSPAQSEKLYHRVMYKNHVSIYEIRRQLRQYGAYPQYVSIHSYSTLCYKRRHWLAYIGLHTLAFDQRVYVWVRSNGIVYFLYMKYVLCILLYIVACTLCSLVWTALMGKSLPREVRLHLNTVYRSKDSLPSLNVNKLKLRIIHWLSLFHFWIALNAKENYQLFLIKKDYIKRVFVASG